MSEFKRAFLPAQTVFTDELNDFSVLPTASDRATEDNHLVNLATLNDEATKTDQKIEATKNEVLATAQALVDGAKLGRSYKGEIDSSAETLSSVEVGASGASILIWGDGESNGSYQSDGASWMRLENAASGSSADGALWYVRDTKQLWAVQGDGLLFGDAAVEIGVASPPLEISGDGAVEVLNGRISLNPTALEIGGPDEVAGANLKVAYEGPLLGSNTSTLASILAKIERNQRRETRPLAFTVTKEAIEALTSDATTIVVQADSIPDGFARNTAQLPRMKLFGGGEMKSSSYSISESGQSVSIAFSDEIVSAIRAYPENYDGVLELPIIPFGGALMHI